MTNVGADSLRNPLSLFGIAMEFSSVNNEEPPDLSQEITNVTGPFASGAFCDVFKGEWKRDGKVCVVAMKRLRVYVDQPEPALQLFHREVNRWFKFRHPHILPFLGYSIENDFRRFSMISPWANNGNCMQYLQKHPEARRLPLVRQVADALDYLHSGGAGFSFVHGDLKGDNVLVADNGEALLADFGLARHVEAMCSLSQTGLKLPNVGHARFAAPELLVTDTRPTKESDVYAFGCLGLQIFSGDAPFARMSEGRMLVLKVIERSKPSRPENQGAISAGLDDEMWLLVDQCLEYEPSSRPSIRDVFLALCAKNDVDAIPSPRMTIPSELALDNYLSPAYQNQSQASPSTNTSDVDVFDGLEDLTGMLVLPKDPFASDMNSDAYLIELDRGGRREKVLVKAFRCTMSLRADTDVRHRARMLYLRQRARTWSSFDHPSILPLYGIADFRGIICFVSPYVAQGNCINFLRQYPSFDRNRLILQIADALEYLHSGRSGRVCAHGDLEGDNILISDAGRALLDNFGLSDYEDNSFVGEQFPQVFWAPELLIGEGNRKSPQTDVYAFGCLVIQIFTGRWPFGDRSLFDVLSGLVNGVKPERPSDPAVKWAGFDDRLWALVDQCLDHQPDRRPTMNEITRTLRKFRNEM